MRRCAGLWLAALLVLSIARPAAAFEFFDGRLQLHGFGESIFRVLNSNFDSEYDLSQMQFLLNLEAELDIAPDGVGPFSAISAFARVEVRYDCIWTRGCSLAPGLDHVGNRIIRQPHERSNGREQDTFSGTAFSKGDGCGPEGCRLQHNGRVTKLKDAGAFASIFENKGPDQVLKTEDDPAPLIFGDFADYRVSFAKVPGSVNDRGVFIQTPLRPQDNIPTENGLFRFYGNTSSRFDADPSCQASSAKPAVGCKFGFEFIESFADNGWPNNPGVQRQSNQRVGDKVLNPEAFNPYRPFPTYSASKAAKMNIPKWEASGLYKPSPGLQRFLMNENLGPFDQNFSQSQLSWNLGASQQDEWFLKEAYFDIEMMDGRLWFRIGMQTIVWGKTEIFRSQDQWNPQDVGLATLPSLEESRIGLWAARMTYSFYDVGPMEDVRLELAMLLDEFEPVDLGRCGEPYAPSPVFGKCLGLFAHSAVGIGVAGEVRPMNWWDSTRGIEVGGRLEWRWKRFSFALTDYWGFNDFPTADTIYKYSRNVDPKTGRPRFGMSDLPCDPQAGLRKGCLGVVNSAPYPAEEMENFDPVFLNADCGFTLECWGRGGLTNGVGDEVQNTRILANKGRNQKDSARKSILRNHHANQTFFDFACAASVGFTDIIPDLVTECGLNIFGSNKVLVTDFDPPFDQVPVVAGISIILGGGSVLFDVAINLLNPAALGTITTVPLNHNDLGPGICPSGKFCQGGEWTSKSRTAEGFGGLWGGTEFPPAGAPSRPGNGANILFGLFGSVASAFTPEQQALLGCGAYWGTSCDRQGMDLLNAEASALFQSWPGFDGTPNFGYMMTDKGQPAPGTVGFKGGSVCTRYERGKTFILPGCRGPGDPGYRVDVDGHPYFNELLNHVDTGLPGIPNASDFNAFDAVSTSNGCPSILDGTAANRLRSDKIRLFNPINCQAFHSEMSAMSFNFLALAVLFSGDADENPNDPDNFDVFDPENAFEPGRCSLSTPQFCSVVRSLLGATGVGRNSIKAGGNFTYGRRDFTWHGGQELALRYDRRNVLGFSTDFSEDWSKTNWGMEATWISSVRFADRNEASGLTDADVYNLTISIDRPTFVNFLNANRTLFFNTQWFFSYVPDHTPGFSSNGPWNVLATFTALTGYFQDRLFAVLTVVYDIQSSSGAGLPTISYRFNEAFSVQFGMAFFFGDLQKRDPFLMPAALGNRTGSDQYTDFVQNGLAVVRDRDEFFFRIRYTF